MSPGKIYDLNAGFGHVLSRFLLCGMTMLCMVVCECALLRKFSNPLPDHLGG